VAFRLTDAFISIKARNDTEKGLRDVENAVTSSLQSLSQVIVGALSFGAIVNEFRNIFREGVEANRVLQNLKSNLSLVTTEATAATKDFDQFSASIEAITTVGGGATKMLASQFVSHLGLTGDQLKKVSVAAIGLSKSLGIDLNASAKLIISAVSGNTAMLRKFGISLDETATPQEKLNQLLEMGVERFKVAEDEVQTMDGSLTQLTNTLGGVREAWSVFFNNQDTIQGVKTLNNLLLGFSSSAFESLAFFTDPVEGQWKFLADAFSDVLLGPIDEPGRGLFPGLEVMTKVGEDLTRKAQTIAKTRVDAVKGTEVEVIQNEELVALQEAQVEAMEKARAEENTRLQLVREELAKRKEIVEEIKKSRREQLIGVRETIGQAHVDMFVARGNKQEALVLEARMKADREIRTLEAQRGEVVRGLFREYEEEREIFHRQQAERFGLSIEESRRIGGFGASGINPLQNLGTVREFFDNAIREIQRRLSFELIDIFSGARTREAESFQFRDSPFNSVFRIRGLPGIGQSLEIPERSQEVLLMKDQLRILKLIERNTRTSRGGGIVP